jgi:hypothetical protein
VQARTTHFAPTAFVNEANNVPSKWRPAAYGPTTLGALDRRWDKGP